MENLDYKRLLQKYIWHVLSCEGAHFVSYANTSLSDVRFTTLEVDALKKMVSEEPLPEIPPDTDNTNNPG